MKRRTFLKGIAALLAAPLAFLGVKKTVPLEFGRIEGFRFIQSDIGASSIEPLPKVVWRRYEELPPSLSPLCEGVVPSGSRLVKAYS